MLALWEKRKKKYDKPRQRIKKQRHYFAYKGLSSQSCIFSSNHVQMWELDHKEGWRTDAFELWSWRRLLRVCWTARRSNQSILNEINPEYSLEQLILKLRLQYFGHLMQRFYLSKKTLMLGKIEGRLKMKKDKIVGWHHLQNAHELEQVPGDSEGQGSLAYCSPWGCRARWEWATEQPQHNNKIDNWEQFTQGCHTIENVSKCRVQYQAILNHILYRNCT